MTVINATNWAELERQVYDASFTIGAEDTNAITVNVQLLDRNGNAIDWPACVSWYLAADSAGATIGTAPDGGTAAGTDGLLIEAVAQLAGLAISEADGDIDFVLTESGALTSYLVIVMPNGQLKISGAITHSA